MLRIRAVARKYSQISFHTEKDMDWLIRFTLGLKARPEDAKALWEALPELRNLDPRFERRRHFWIFDPDFHTNEELIEALRQWASEVESPDDHWPQDHRNCPSNNCPLRNNQAKEANDGEPFIARFMVAAGGPDVKPPDRVSLIWFGAHTLRTILRAKSSSLTHTFIPTSVQMERRAGL